MWHWKTDNESIQLDGFDSQEQAEAWLTANYEDLLDEGATEVTLFEGDRQVYGPMGLEPA